MSDSVICSVVKSVGHYLPQKILTNFDLEKMMDTSDQWIQERTGIKQRRIAADHQGTSDLGFLAACDALKKANLKPNDVDLIIASTLSPDYFFPGIGVLIQNKLETQAAAMDIRGQCSGFSWAISTADAMIKSHQFKRVLVIGAEIQSRVIEYSNRGRNVSVLFGDGAGAMILEAQESSSLPSAQNTQRGVIDNIMGSDGSGADFLAIKRPGMASKQKEFISTQETSEKAYLPIMDGRHVFKNAVTRLCETAQKLFSKHEISADDIDILIPHQANLRINSAVAEKLGICGDKVFNNIEHYGNTTSASLPICMSEASESKKLKPGSLVMTLAFGSGFTWGGNLIRW